MESRWGWRVTDAGLGGLGATLAARYLQQFGWYYVTNAPWLPNACLYVYVPPDTVPDAPYVLHSLVKHTPHFPYGYDVEPNAPM